MNATRPPRAALPLALFVLSLPGPAQDDPVPFDEELWDLRAGEVVEHLGRPSLRGTAMLRDAVFTDGVIEVDVAVTGARSYPGIVFRARADNTFEECYLRPHRAGLYPDALQYCPAFHGQTPWQLYHGPGYTAEAALPVDRWVPLRLEIRGAQARVFLDDAFLPALEIPRLVHGAGSGALGLVSPRDGSAYFSNFRFHPDDALEFPDPPEVSPAPDGATTGWLTDWEIAGPFPASAVDVNLYPSFFALFGATWRDVEVDAPGLLNLSRHVARTGPGKETVFARTVVHSDDRRRVKLSLGYSDEVTVFHNSVPVFRGNSAYHSRDPSFVGVVGLHDHCYLELAKGRNELFVTVSETFGGHAFTGRLDVEAAAPAVDHGRAELLWETPADFVTPESVQYDAARDVLYVTSFDQGFATRPSPSGFVSQLSLAGDVIERNWLTGLVGPCGMALDGDTLWIAERGNLVEADIPSGTIRTRHPIPRSVFLNDVACDGKGRVYVSDAHPTAPGNRVAVWRLAGGIVEPWIEDADFSRTNGLFVHGTELLVGCSGDCTLRAVDLETRRVRLVATLGGGIVDGVRVDGDGRYLVSLWHGPTFRITPAGEPTEILNPGPDGRNVADFEFVDAERMLVVPTFTANRVRAYLLHEK